MGLQKKISTFQVYLTWPSFQVRHLRAAKSNNLPAVTNEAIYNCGNMCQVRLAKARWTPKLALQFTVMQD